ncbi:type II secretion system F family protein [Clostridium sp. CMCC3677]|uniref:type II secretion system F family protein n=1 Tax=Clostridium sp. CMCC3677 TaxID=2949963 RepID=UPI0013F04A48|nr:type II secretion system F family protein [Clostridium sp. CMCC3677]NFG63270.1 type II secretion system F family protein [Clostridium botulinum]NFQ08112.1 type II secretion system F family protein [Clostridium botulinum]
MANFKYRAMNTDREKIEGTHEADSKGEVIEFISSNGYYPLMVEEIIESKKIEFKFNNKVKFKDLSIFCRQFYTMLDAGVPILTCLDILTSQTTNKKLKETLKEVEEDVEKGGILSDAMRKHNEVFPNLLVSLVAAGEESGNLDSIMLRMANHYEKENKVNNKVKNAMIYPIILGLVAISAVIFILTYIMPTFTTMFTENGISLPWSTRFLLWLSGSLKENWFMILLAIIGIIIAIKYIFKTERGVIAASKLKLKLPVIRRLNEMIIVSRFTRTLSTLLSSGLPLVQALDIVMSVIDNKIAQNAIIKVKEQVVRGETLNSSLKETGVFPQMLYSMIKIGEETGSLDEILNKTADFYDEELETTIQGTVALMEPALIVIMGLIIGFIIISIMIPMFDSYNQI